MAVTHVGASCAEVRAAVDDFAVPGHFLGLALQPGVAEQTGRVVADPASVATQPPVALPQLPFEIHDVLGPAEVAQR